MDESGEKRLCKKCGKRLPSSNNFCMYCGYNNNLNDDELEALKSINSDNIYTKDKQELLNKSINAKDREIVIQKGKKEKTVNGETPSVKPEIKNSLLTNLIYVFIILDVNLISFLFIFKSNNLLYEVFKYNLDNYDKVINLDNNSFLVLKNNKLKLIGENDSFNTELLDTITKKEVVDIGVDSPGSDYIYLETKDKLYSFSYVSDEPHDFEIDSLSGNVYKDVSISLHGRYSEDDDYNTLVGSTYFIKDNSLYAYKSTHKRITTENKRYAFGYASNKVLDSSQLDIENPEIIYATDMYKSIIIKGDNIIKVYTYNKLIQSITQITYNDKTYNISDFKYILYKDNRFLFVCKDGSMINYKYDDDYITKAEKTDDLDKYIKTNSKELNKNVIVKDQVTFESLFSAKNIIKTYFDANKDKLIIYIVVLIVASLIMIGVMYFFRKTQFVLSSLIATGVLFVFYIILFIYLYITQKGQPEDIVTMLKSSIDLILLLLTGGVLVAQVKEIVNYISYKFNIETVYHFFLLFIGTSSTLIAIGLLTSQPLIALLLPGIIWIFLCTNDEDYIEYEHTINKILIIIGLLIVSIVICLILCTSFHICNYYFFILAAAFTFACFAFLFEDHSITNYVVKMMLAFSALFVRLISYVASGITNIILIDHSFGDEYVEYMTKSYMNYYVKIGFYLIIWLAIISLIIAVLLFIVNLIFRNIVNKINNRLIRIFVYMIIMTLFVTGIVIALPYIAELTTNILHSLVEFEGSIGLLS